MEELKTKVKNLKGNNLVLFVLVTTIITSLLCFTDFKLAKTQLPQPELRIEPQTYSASTLGETFNISVNIYNVTVEHRLVTVQFRVGYDPMLLQVLGVFEGPFMQSFNNTSTPPYTLFVYYVEDDPLYGPNVLVGIVIYPNDTGVWTNFPYGNGTLAIITFKAISQMWYPLSCNLTLFDTLLVNDDAEEISHTAVGGSYSISEKPLSITYEPAKPSLGEVIIFESTQYVYGNETINYAWDFGDGYNMTTNEPTAYHIYASIGSYDVTLVVSYGDEMTNATITVQVGFYPSLTVDIETSAMYYRRETIEFYILVSSYGKSVNTTYLEALLYYNGTLYANLTEFINTLGEGLYMIQYNLGANAQTGTYTLVVNARYYDLYGTAIKSFNVREVDLSAICRAFGAALGMPGWNSSYDINENGKIDGADIAFICRYLW